MFFMMGQKHKQQKNKVNGQKSAKNRTKPK